MSQLQKLFFLLTAIALFGCIEKENDNKNESLNNHSPNMEFKIRNAHFGNDEALIKTKYESAILKCQLWVKKGAKLDKTSDKSVVVEWDIKNEFDVKKELKVEKKIDGYKVEYEILVNDLYIYDVIYITDGKEYKRDMSPVVELNYKYYSSTYYAPGVTSQGKGSGDMSKIYENIDSPLVSISGYSDLDPSIIYTNEMECNIVAKIKPQFQNEFPESKEY